MLPPAVSTRNRPVKLLLNPDRSARAIKKAWNARPARSGPVRQDTLFHVFYAILAARTVCAMDMLLTQSSCLLRR